MAWDDEGLLDLGADNLRNLAVEQAGGIGHERIWEWMHRNGLTVEAASTALGISPRMLAFYRNGRKPIPRHVWLACRGWELMHQEHQEDLRFFWFGSDAQQEIQKTTLRPTAGWFPLAGEPPPGYLRRGPRLKGRDHERNQDHPIAR